ncbi:MAG TPA: D-tyrosyl-tRNA(Tyr) deacylase [Clostridiales bacterium]|jgi:D-tyrosyl-tRNA(Tyr) deacylase|nr:D-tyrosyl-tRNA(Tyr) deacylase [Clostridiales bacterium]
MRAVVQRVSYSDVTSGEQTVGSIRTGLTVLLGVGRGDTEQDAKYMAEKITGLRIFEDEDEKMNLSVQDVGGSVLAISQFTLYGDVKKGKRPSFTDAAGPEQAETLYEKFCEHVRACGVGVEQGIFQTHMLVRIHNDGPVTIMIDSKKEF